MNYNLFANLPQVPQINVVENKAGIFATAVYTAVVKLDEFDPVMIPMKCEAVAKRLADGVWYVQSVRVWDLAGTEQSFVDDGEWDWRDDAKEQFPFELLKM